MPGGTLSCLTTSLNHDLLGILGRHGTPSPVTRRVLAPWNALPGEATGVTTPRLDEPSSRPAPAELDVSPEANGHAALPTAPPPSNRRIKTFDSLIDVPAFRWYLGSMMGNWSAIQMQQVARGYLAYQLTDSFAALGLVELANTWPRLFLALYGGVVADKVSRRVIIQVGQALVALNAGMIALLLFTGTLEFWHVIMASFVQGVLNSFVLPARQAMIPEIVGPNRLMNAYALNVFVLNTMRLFAPAAAGGIIAFLMVRTGGDVFVSVGTVFALMALLNVWAVIGLFRVPKTNAATRAALRGETAAVAANGQAAHRGGEIAAVAANGQAARRRLMDRAGLRDMLDGLGYMRRNSILLALMAIQSVTAMLGIVYQRMLPGFVEEVLGYSEDESAAAMGFLLTMTAIGALVGSLLIASLPDRNRGKILVASLILFGATQIVFASTTVFWVSAAVVVVLGIGQAMRQSITNILIQSRTDETYRGRVSSILMLDDGLEALGVFCIAIVADVVGVQWAVGAVGVLMLLCGLALWSTRRIRDLA